MANPSIELHEPLIVLRWMTRLRWLAAVGQVAAVAVSMGVLGLELAPLPIGLIIALTVLTNIALELVVRRSRPPGWMVPATVALDVVLLTALLMFCGGPDNPFRVLYVVHIVMAVVVLGYAVTWLIVVESAVCYGLLVAFHVRVPIEALPHQVLRLGDWLALVLVGVLIAYFVGRITQALRDREAEIAAIRERAARTEMLASLTTLAAGAAHEMGTPMGTIAIAAKELELALEQNPDMKPWAEDARLIRTEVDRCRNILERMRVDVSDELRLRPAQVSLAQFVDFLRQDLSPGDWERVRPAGVTDEVVRLPTRAMRQALNVLLRNALEVTPEGAFVELRVSHVPGRVTFEVEDHGPGMEPEVARRAGEPFFTTKPVGKGMGMGLFLVRMVAEQTKGKFELHSTKGVGTRCVLSIPVQEVGGAEPASAAPGPGGTRVVGQSGEQAGGSGPSQGAS
ncbi:MAG: ATP-binding protein [Tepidisphaerales bacterium]